MKKKEMIIYQPNSSVQLEVLMDQETVWLNRQQIALLFGRDVKTIGKHINNALSQELAELPTVANFATVQNEGGRKVTRNMEYYNLDVILSVGYRVNSPEGVAFRIWANSVLKDYLMKGYAVNEKILKEKNAELINRLHALSVLIINDIPLTKELAMDMMMTVVKNEQ